MPGKKGMKQKPLLQGQIEWAINETKSASAASRLLGVAYNTFKKYAKMYKYDEGVSLLEKCKNPTGRGIQKGGPLKSGRYALDDILAGKYPGYSQFKLKQRLIFWSYLEEKCDSCGFEERRLTDHKVPLLLDFKDGDRTNYSLDNLRLLCFNCYFLQVGNIGGRRPGPRKKWGVTTTDTTFEGSFEDPY